MRDADSYLKHGFRLVRLTCSPKTGPGILRVLAGNEKDKMLNSRFSENQIAAALEGRNPESTTTGGKCMCKPGGVR